MPISITTNRFYMIYEGKPPKAVRIDWLSPAQSIDFACQELSFKQVQKMKGKMPLSLIAEKQYEVELNRITEKENINVRNSKI